MIYTHTHTQTHTHWCAGAHPPTHTHTHTHTRMHACMHASTHALMFFSVSLFSHRPFIMPNLIPPKIPDGEKVDFDVSGSKPEGDGETYFTLFHVLSSSQ